MRVRKAKQLFRLYPRYTQKRLFELTTGVETWVNYFELVCKCSNRVCATKQSRGSVIAKRSTTVPKYLYCIPFLSMDLLFKLLSVTAKYYRKVVLQWLNEYLRYRRPKKRHGTHFLVGWHCFVAQSQIFDKIRSGK